MLNKDDIKKLAKKILHTQQKRKSLNLMHPKREWAIGVFVALMLVLGTTVWSGVTYLTTKNSANRDTNVTVADVVVYRESHVAEALSVRDSRQAVIDGTPLPVIGEPATEDTATTTATTTTHGFDVSATSSDDSVPELGV